MNGIGVGRAHDPHGGGAAVLLVVGVEDEEHVERPGQDRRHLVVVADPEGHVEEVLRVGERVVGVDGRHPDAEAVAVRGQRRRLGDEPQDLLGPDAVVEDVLGLGVVGRHGGQARDEHPHRVGVVVEALHEPLAHVVVQEGVVDDLVRPRLELLRGRELAVQQEVGDLEVRGVLRQLLDRVAAVAEDAGITVEVGHRRRAGRGGQEGRVVHPEVGVELPQRRGREHPVVDGHRDLLARPVVDDRDGVGHVPSRGSGW